MNSAAVAFFFWFCFLFCVAVEIQNDTDFESSLHHELYRWRPYRVEYTGSLLTSEVKRRRARLVLGWGTAWEHLRVLLAFLIFPTGYGARWGAYEFLPASIWRWMRRSGISAGGRRIVGCGGPVWVMQGEVVMIQLSIRFKFVLSDLSLRKGQ